MFRTPLTSTLRCATAALVLCVMLAACGSGDPTMIGFSGPLEGTYSDLGVQGRNGVQLAFETINEAGGVDGRPLMLLFHDDGNTPQSARLADQQLIDAGAQVIIGHMTSSQSVAGYPVAEEARVLMLSPTTSTPLLEGKKDFFFRVIPVSTDRAGGLARHCLENEGLRTIATITDMDNEAYTVSFNKTFADVFTSGGGQVLREFQLSSSRLESWSEVIDELVALQVPAIGVALSARDLASLARELHHRGVAPRIYSSMWAYTSELIQVGGKSVEGIVFAVSSADDNAFPAFREFQGRYLKRFGWKPNFAAAFGYECGLVLAEGLRQTGGDLEKLPQTLTRFKSFPGIIGPFDIDAFGDVQRPAFIVSIEGREFKTLTVIEHQ